MAVPMPYPAQVEFDADRHITRWRPLVQWLLAIPHLFVAQALRSLRAVLTLISFFTVLFTEQIPRPLFDMIAMTYRYEWRALSYAVFIAAGDLGVRFQPSATDDGAEPHTQVTITYPEKLNRWKPLYKWILAIPHLFVAAALAIAGVFVLIAGFLAVLVPASLWSDVFVSGHGFATSAENVLVGPFIAVISFVCSVGNIPLAAVLWNGGISFGGVIAFIFGDLIIAPILNIYRKYYGLKMAAFLGATFYATMVAAGLIVEFLFEGIGIERKARNAKVMDAATVSWNYTTYLNIVFLIVAAALVWRYFRKGGGWSMLKMMNEPMHDHDHGHAHDHAHHCH